MTINKKETLKNSKRKIIIGKALDSGMKRKDSPNQDAIAIGYPLISWHHDPLLVVADGMGGQQEGTKAAFIVINSLRRQIRFSFNRKKYKQALLRGIQKAHKKISQYVKRDANIFSMGSAVAAVIITPQEIVVANVGDARIYLINQDEIKQVSFDQSFVAEQVRQGLLTPQQARNHPRRNVLYMSITSKREKVDSYINTLPYTGDAYILLCSDGLWGTVSEDQIQDVVLELSPQEAAQKLVEMANMNQGPDNISVIIAKV